MYNEYFFIEEIYIIFYILCFSVAAGRQCTMIAPVQRKPTVKIAGYLEKRGKMVITQVVLR